MKSKKMRGKNSGETSLRHNQKAKGQYWGHISRFKEILASPNGCLQTETNVLLQFCYSDILKINAV